MITHYTTAEDERQGFPVLLDLAMIYDVDHPLAVTLEFSDPETGTNEWFVDRASLARGLKEPTGYGDVQFWLTDSDGARLAVCLTSPEGSATVTVLASEVQTFLTRTEELLPIGAEGEILQAELDAWLEELLEES